MPEDHIFLTKRWFTEVWNQQNAGAVPELLAADCVMHGITETGADLHGRDEFLKMHAALLSAFPDMKFEVHDCFGSGDQIAVRWSASMQHTGHGLGIPPTNAPVHITGLGIARFIDGKVVETWDCWDRMAMFQQIEAATKAMTA